MSSGIPFSWLESNGWLVLSGRADALSEIRALALSRLISDGAVAYISLMGDMGDELMDDMSDLGAPSGYLVDLDDDDNNAIFEQLRDASMIVIEPGDSISSLKQLMTQTVIQAMKEALNHGALILFEGIASSLAGEHIVTDEGRISAGLKLVNNVYISPDTRSILDTDAAQDVYLQSPETVFIGIQQGSALVLGPAGGIEIWGEKQVTISLGSSSQDNDTMNNNV